MTIDKRNRLIQLLEDIDEAYSSMYSYGVIGAFEMSGDTEDCHLLNGKFNKLVDEAMGIIKNMESVEFGNGRIDI